MAQNKGVRKFVIFAFLAGLLIFVFQKGWFSPAQSGTLRFLSPVTSRAADALRGTGDFIVSFVRIGSLSRSVRLLENKNAQLEARLADLQGVREENDLLRRQMDLLPREKFHLVMANVVSHTTDGVSDALIINRGSRDGLRDGLPVIIDEGVVVGKVSKVSELTATIMLVTDAEFRLAALVQGGDAQGLVHGEKGIDISLEEVPRNKKINVGDKVITSGVDGVFPPDLYVGVIRSIEAPGNEIFQTAKVTAPLDVRKVRIVSVIVGR